MTHWPTCGMDGGAEHYECLKGSVARLREAAAWMKAVAVEDDGHFYDCKNRKYLVGSACNPICQAGSQLAAALDGAGEGE